MGEFHVSYLQPLDRFIIHDGASPPAPAHVERIIRNDAPIYSRFVIQSGDNCLDSPVEPFLELCIETTTLCNLSCRVCISESSPWANGVLPLLKLKQVLARRRMPFRVTVTGGEFFSRRDWRDFAGYLLDQEVGLVISTNGTLLNKSTVHFFAGAPVVFALSLDGLEKTHDTLRRRPGNFRQTFSALLMLREAGFQIHVYSVLQESNMSEMIPLSNSLSSLGIVEHRIMYIVPRGRGVQHRVEFDPKSLKELRELRLPHLVTLKTGQHLFPLLRSTGELQWPMQGPPHIAEHSITLRHILDGGAGNEQRLFN